MKSILSLLFFFLLVVIITACQSPKKKNNEQFKSNSNVEKKSDTLILDLPNESADPFGLGDSPFTYLAANHTIDTVNIHDMFSEDEPDTTLLGTYYTVISNSNQFVFYTRSDGKELFDSADILTPDFSTNMGIQVGMSKQEVIQKINNPAITTLPGYLLLAGDEDNSYPLCFEFKSDKLRRISYDGYLD